MLHVFSFFSRENLCLDKIIGLELSKWLFLLKKNSLLFIAFFKPFFDQTWSIHCNFVLPVHIFPIYVSPFCV